MATDAQVAANRLNAQESTGPRTTEGKAVVAQNAVKHGLLARATRRWETKCAKQTQWALSRMRAKCRAARWL
jgi:hypothetical protein